MWTCADYYAIIWCEAMGIGNPLYFLFLGKTWLYYSVRKHDSFQGVVIL